MEFEDSLELNKSQVVSVTTQGTADVSLSLDDAPAAGLAILTGTVYDTEVLVGTPVANAVVFVFDATGNVVSFAKTNSLGLYTVSGLTNSTAYTAVAVKDGYTATSPSPFTASILLVTVMNFAIVQNTDFSLNTVYGLIKDEAEATVPGVTVILSDSATGDVISTTGTIDDGEYVLYNIPTGSYTIKTVKNGYYGTTSDAIALTTSQNHAENITMEAVSDPNNGVISGIIRDSDSQVVENAFVGLYSITEDDEPETLIRYTFTNSNGRYAFGDVVPGSYIVKAKLSTEST